MRLLVIDGNSIVNRAFYAIKLLSTKDGRFTNAIYGFMNILIKLRQQSQCDRAAIAFDLKAPTFRHKQYGEYKAGRKPMPTELRSQIPVLKELLTVLGYTVVEKEGYEADDILGTLSHSCGKDDLCFLATGDRDSLQLISDNTVVLLASTKMGKAVTTVYDKEKLFEEYGVEPSGMIEIKALMGDSSDNIPGVAGIGQKTAMSLISQYKTIDYIYEHLDELDIKKGVHDKLAADKGNAYLSHDLGTICLDAPIDTAPEAYEISQPDRPKAIRLLAELEMFGMIEKLGLTSEGEEVIAAENKADSVTLETEYASDLPSLLKEIEKDDAAYFTFDSDGESITEMVFCKDERLICVKSDCDGFEEFLKGFFESETKKITTDMKTLYRCAFALETKLNAACFDTTLAGYILNPSAGSYDVIRLAEERRIAVPDVKCDDESTKQFAVKAAVIKAVFERTREEIEENDQHELYFQVELPLSRVLAEMEHAGFLVSREQIGSYGDELEKEIESLTESIYSQADEEFNLNSPKQLGVVLFEKLGLPSKKKTKTGYSTNAEILEELSYDYPIVKDILRFRTLSKLKSTYCDGLVKVIGADGRIRSTLNQTETRTGRISSLNPNLQNIPIRSEEGRQLRKFFIAPDGRSLVDADYSQIELRVLASMAGDENMINAFNNGEDIHRTTASQVFDMPMNMVTPLMRSRAKAVNFGIVYGMGAFSLSKDIGVSVKEADSYIKNYLHKFSSIDKFMKDVIEQAKENGYAKTLFKRRRYLPELTASNKLVRASGERIARNMPIQGTAADIIKIAMIKVSDRLAKEFPSARLIMQVHDELIVECDEKDSDKVASLLKEEMEAACSLKVKLLADVHVGKTWYDAK